MTIQAIPSQVFDSFSRLDNHLQRRRLYQVDSQRDLMPPTSVDYGPSNYSYHQQLPSSISSISSTFTVPEEADCAETMDCAEKVSKKEVTFVEEYTIVHTIYGNNSEFQDFWYTSSELDEFKKDARRDAKQIMKPLGLDRTTTGEASLYHSAIMRLLDECQQEAGTRPQPTTANSSACQIHIEPCSFFCVPPELIGLERWIKKLRQEKHCKRRLMGMHMRQFIIGSQATTNTEGNKEEMNPGISSITDEYEYSALTLRSYCEHLSLPSRLFAHYLALASAATEIEPLR